MRTSIKESLLRSYIRESLLNEDDGYGGGDYGYGGMGGGAYGSKEDFAAAFITPFTDIFKTGLAGVKQIGVETRAALVVGIQTILTTLIPFWSYHYADVFDKRDERIKAIENEYSDVYNRTKSALKSDDAALLAFMASPGIFMSAKGAKVGKDLLSVISGGASNDIYQQTKDALKKAGRWSVGDDTGTSSRSSKSRGSRRSPSSTFESLMRVNLNEESDKKKKTFDEDALLKNKKFLEKALGEDFRSMSEAAKEAYRKTYKELLEKVTKLKSGNSVEEITSGLQKVIANPPKGVKLPKPPQELKKSLDALKNLGSDAKDEEAKKKAEEEKKKAEEEMVKGFNKSPGNFFAKQLEDQLKQDIEKISKLGVNPEQTDYVKDTRKAIQSLKSA